MRVCSTGHGTERQLALMQSTGGELSRKQVCSKPLNGQVTTGCIGECQCVTFTTAFFDPTLPALSFACTVTT
jgi:hypothetical protein